MKYYKFQCEKLATFLFTDVWEWNMPNESFELIRPQQIWITKESSKKQDSALQAKCNIKFLAMILQAARHM